MKLRTSLSTISAASGHVSLATGTLGGAVGGTALGSIFGGNLATSTNILTDGLYFHGPDTSLTVSILMAIDGSFVMSGSGGGVMLRRAHQIIRYVAVTTVWFAPLSHSEIEAYVQSGEPMDKAGAYAIQGLASRFSPRIEGSYSNVVGLPVALVSQALSKLGL